MCGTTAQSYKVFNREELAEPVKNHGKIHLALLWVSLIRNESAYFYATAALWRHCLAATKSRMVALELAS